MTVIPAKLAGVPEVLVVTPPCRHGESLDDFLAAAAVAGADRIFLMGGAQAVAALSYGTESVPKADKIVGPGNIYVATAKRMVYGMVDIDMIAGPSEVFIIADGRSDPAHLSADLLSQAEHDVLSAAILATPDEKLAEAVAARIEEQLKTLPRKDITIKSIEQNGVIFSVNSLEEGIELYNAVAPEHLELFVDDPFSLFSYVKHAGSVFLGRHTPEALGDYMAGPNHTLPTGGTARFSSPLGVEDFQKKTSFLYYDKKAFQKEAEQTALFARHEGLEGHARSALTRLEG
jgi:histidinol dehydrogenase